MKWGSKKLVAKKFSSAILQNRIKKVHKNEYKYYDTVFALVYTYPKSIVSEFPSTSYDIFFALASFSSSSNNTRNVNMKIT